MAAPSFNSIRVMKQRCSQSSIADCAELREVHARLDKIWGAVLDRGQTPCCYALSGDHILLRALERLLGLFPRDKAPRRRTTLLSALDR
jgi:hypothetical protein